MSIERRIRTQLERLDRQGLSRTSPRISERDGPRYRIDGHPVIGFCSNDYLGFAQAPNPSGPHTGTSPGAAGSRLVCGDLTAHRDLERRLANLVDCEDAVLFPSGYQLNAGVLPALVSSEDTVYSDALNHASLIDGLRLSRCRPHILTHLQAPPQPCTPNQVTWWVSETIFSMDGDNMSVRDISRASAAGVSLYLDDAHSFGLYPRGVGWPQHHRIRPTVYVATLSKAAGCAGAFVAATETICRWIRTRARSFVFSTGISPQVVASIDHALNRLRSCEGDEARARLQSNRRLFAKLFKLASVPTTPIVPVIIGANTRTVAVSRKLLELGYHVQPIRPPTVPEGTARLRITLSAAHEPAHIEGLVAALQLAQASV